MSRPDFDAGDYVVRVPVPVVPYGGPDYGINNGKPDSGRMVGRVFRVEAIVGPVCGHWGVVLEGFHSGHATKAWPAIAFRKIDKADDAFTQEMRELRPLKAPAHA